MNDPQRREQLSDHVQRDEAFLSDPARWMPRLERLLHEQATLCASLTELGRRQGELIQEEQMEPLLGVLAERQSVIERFTELSQELEPFRSRWEDLMAQAPPERRDDFRRRVDDLSKAIEDVARRDESDRQALESKRTALAGELGGVQRGRGAVAAYGRSAAASQGPRYQDREG